MMRADAETPARLRHAVSWLINLVSLHSHRLVGDAFAAAGARGYHYRLLATLDEYGPSSQADLGRRTGIDRSDVVAALNELAAKNLIDRSPDPSDRRRNVITLTPDGARHLEELEAVVTGVQDDLLAPSHRPNAASSPTCWHVSPTTTPSDAEEPPMPPTPPAIRLVELPPAAMEALLADDLAGAGAAAGIPLTSYFVTDEAKFLWRFRLAQLARDPCCAPGSSGPPWRNRAARSSGTPGFHGAPDADGTVTIAYSVDPAHRRKGYARAMLAALLERAASEPSVTTVRATISPDNAASLATIAGHGFTHVGEQWDEEDGRELIFDRPAR
ncbi:GNAT family N-acetyltransferase [Actinomadura madurae]|uniref:GNAT family N-acetyltransferase n=1 Tax=Actinomadura madurae TaxID=1993 RepID=UPI0020D20853|nr:GNAT family N-acetyltransferase [Actinomadura madurae]MCQ0017681.1 GNAT family N-acetyltransferase [Actinomadura madurae]